MIRPVDLALQFRRGSASARWVLVALVSHDVTASGECWPSVGRLVEITELGEKTVRRAIRDLEELGAIEVHRRKGRGGNVYRLPWVGDGPENAVIRTALFGENAVTTTAFDPECGHRDRVPPSENAVTTTAYPNECGHHDRIPDRNAVTMTAGSKSTTATTAAVAGDVDHLADATAEVALALIADAEADAAIAAGRLPPDARSRYRASILRRLRTDARPEAVALAASGLDPAHVARRIQPEAFPGEPPERAPADCPTCEGRGTVVAEDPEPPFEHIATGLCPDCASDPHDPRVLPEHLRPFILRYREQIAS